MPEPRKTPCDTCPYRVGVPSGIWDATEYAKLLDYDKPTGEQPANLFMCHSDVDVLCAGWLQCHDPYELLAVRISIATGQNDESIYDYQTDVEVFGSGEEAAKHGMRDVEHPSNEAIMAIERVRSKRRRRRW